MRIMDQMYYKQLYRRSTECLNRPGRALNTMENQKQLSYGQKAVGLPFNPSGNYEVSKCKQGFADLIDQMQQLRANANGSEQVRLASIAITELQGAQMWAVKALTWKD